MAAFVWLMWLCNVLPHCTMHIYAAWCASLYLKHAMHCGFRVLLHDQMLKRKRVKVCHLKEFPTDDLLMANYPECIPANLQSVLATTNEPAQQSQQQQQRTVQKQPGSNTVRDSVDQHHLSQLAGLVLKGDINEAQLMEMLDKERRDAEARKQQLWAQQEAERRKSRQKQQTKPKQQERVPPPPPVKLLQRPKQGNQQQLEAAAATGPSAARSDAVTDKPLAATPPSANNCVPTTSTAAVTKPVVPPPKAPPGVPPPRPPPGAPPGASTAAAVPPAAATQQMGRTYQYPYAAANGNMYGGHPQPVYTAHPHSMHYVVPMVPFTMAPEGYVMPGMVPQRAYVRPADGVGTTPPAMYPGPHAPDLQPPVNDDGEEQGDYWYPEQAGDMQNDVDGYDNEAGDDEKVGQYDDDDADNEQDFYYTTAADVSDHNGSLPVDHSLTSSAQSWTTNAMRQAAKVRYQHGCLVFRQAGKDQV